MVQDISKHFGILHMGCDRTFFIPFLATLPHNLTGFMGVFLGVAYFTTGCGRYNHWWAYSGGGTADITIMGVLGVVYLSLFFMGLLYHGLVCYELRHFYFYHFLKETLQSWVWLI